MGLRRRISSSQVKWDWLENVFKVSTKFTHKSSPIKATDLLFILKHCDRQKNNFHSIVNRARLKFTYQQTNSLFFSHFIDYPMLLLLFVSRPISMRFRCCILTIPPPHSTSDTLKQQSKFVNYLQGRCEADDKKSMGKMLLFNNRKNNWKVEKTHVWCFTSSFFIWVLNLRYMIMLLLRGRGKGGGYRWGTVFRIQFPAETKAKRKSDKSWENIIIYLPLVSRFPHSIV